MGVRRNSLAATAECRAPFLPTHHSLTWPGRPAPCACLQSMFVLFSSLAGLWGYMVYTAKQNAHKIHWIMLVGLQLG